MDREPIGTGRLPPLGGRRATIAVSIGVDLPIPQKPTLGGWHFPSVTEYKEAAVAISPPSGLPRAAAAAAPWRGARPFDGKPGASRLFGGRGRATCPRC